MSRRRIHWLALVATVATTFVLGFAGTHRAAADGPVESCVWEALPGGGWQLIQYNCGRAGCSSPGVSGDPGDIMSTSCNGNP